MKRPARVCRIPRAADPPDALKWRAVCLGFWRPQHKLAIAVQVNTSVARATGKSLPAFISNFLEIILGSQ